MREVMITKNIYEQNIGYFEEVLNIVIEENNLDYIADVVVRKSDVAVTIKNNTLWLGEADAEYNFRKDMVKRKPPK